MLTTAQRSMAGRIGSAIARSRHPAAELTAAARARFLGRFERQVREVARTARARDSAARGCSAPGTHDWAQPAVEHCPRAEEGAAMSSSFDSALLDTATIEDPRLVVLPRGVRLLAVEGLV